MNEYPEYAKVNGKKYKINTSFRVAIECNNIALDEKISDEERGLAIIYKLFGDEGLEDKDNLKGLLNVALKYLACGQKNDKTGKPKKIDMDYSQDMPYIKASFRSDYGINLSKEDMHWYEFYELMNGLSNSELGNCCIFNQIRNIRNVDLKEIKDQKTRKKIAEAQEFFKLKKQVKEKKFTPEQIENMKRFYKEAGIKIEE